MALVIDAPSRPTLQVPTTLHVGSGKSWRADWLNLDVEPRWRPDIVHDLCRPLPPDGQVVVDTERFGPLVIGENSFDEVVAQDVLEHLPDLVTAMTTLLHWLRPGGVLKVWVPYELSLGAWSDPTHVRAFNERSFEYYTNWSWYLGWREHHFALRRLEFVASDFGKELVAKRRPMAEILRTPRAIDQMYAELEKRRLSPEAREVAARFLDAPRG